MENWRQEYNNYRPHNSLDYLTPAEFARRYYEKNQAEETGQSRVKAGTLSLYLDKIVKECPDKDHIKERNNDVLIRIRVADELHEQFLNQK